MVAKNGVAFQDFSKGRVWTYFPVDGLGGLMGGQSGRMIGA